MGTFILIIIGLVIFVVVISSLTGSKEDKPIKSTSSIQNTTQKKTKDEADWIDSALAVSDNNIPLGITYYTNSINIKPTGTAYNNRALLKTKLKDFSGANEDYAKAIQLEPDDSLYYYNRALMNWNRDLEELSIPDLEKSASLGNEKAKKMLLEDIDFQVFTVTDCYLDESQIPHAVLKDKNNSFIFVQRQTAPYNVGDIIKIDNSTLSDFTFYNEATYPERYNTYLSGKQKSLKKIEVRNIENNFFANYGIDYLYHMTHISNLENILKNGLQSNDTVKSKSITFNDISDNQVNDRRNRIEPVHNKSVHAYVPLYFNPKKSNVICA